MWMTIWRSEPTGWRSEERRVGEEGRSLCDWSSDVCSSDLVLRFVFAKRRDGAHVVSQKRTGARGESLLARGIVPRKQAAVGGERTLHLRGGEARVCG